MRHNRAPNLLAVLLQLAIGQFVFNAFISPAKAEHSVRRHLNYSESFDQLNDAIYNQLLNAERSPAEVANELRSSEPETLGEARSPKNKRNSERESTRKTEKAINYLAEHDLVDLNEQTNEELNQQRLHQILKQSAKSDRISSHLADDRISSNQSDLYSVLHKVSHSTLDYSPSTGERSNQRPDQRPGQGPDLVDSLSSDNNRTLLDLLDVDFIGKQLDAVGGQSAESSVHWLIEANSSSSFEKPNKSALNSSVNGHSSKDPVRNPPAGSTAHQPQSNADSPLLANQTSRSRSARSSNNLKLTELVRRVNCAANKDCVISNVCDFNQGLCKCPKNYINVNDMKDQKEIEPVNWPPTHCYAAQQLEKPCIYDEQCIVKHSKCTRDDSAGSQLVCACSLGYASKGRTRSIIRIKM